MKRWGFLKRKPVYSREWEGNTPGVVNWEIHLRLSNSDLKVASFPELSTLTTPVSYCSSQCKTLGFMWLPSDGSLVTAVSPAIQKARVWTNKEYKDNSGLGQLDGFHPVVYCGSLVLFISLGGWRQAQEDVWPHWGCSGPQGKDDTVCVWQNSMVFTEVLSGSGVISVWTKAGGYHCNEDGFTCWASK